MEKESESCEFCEDEDHELRRCTSCQQLYCIWSLRCHGESGVFCEECNRLYCKIAALVRELPDHIVIKANWTEESTRKPNAPQLDKLVAVAYEVCGKVVPTIDDKLFTEIKVD